MEAILARKYGVLHGEWNERQKRPHVAIAMDDQKYQTTVRDVERTRI